MSLWGMLSAWKRSVFLFRAPGMCVLLRAQGHSLPSLMELGSIKPVLPLFSLVSGLLSNNSQPDKICPYAPHALQDQARPD